MKTLPGRHIKAMKTLFCVTKLLSLGHEQYWVGRLYVHGSAADGVN